MIYRLRIAFLLFTLLPFCTVAQKPVLYDYLIQFSGSIGPEEHKAILSALNAQDPDIMMSVSVATGKAKARTQVHLSQSQLEAELAPFGLGVEFILVGVPGDPATRMAMQDFFDGFPVYIDTGDPAADNAAYEAAKQAWLAAHPDGIVPAPSVTDQ
jgi:hypothetical protein